MSHLPSHGRLAGIDYGHKRIGIAVTDPDQVLATPWENYTRRDARLDAEYFANLVARESLVAFVIGLPIYPSGDESDKSREARRFGEWLGALTGLPIGYVDERYTTRQANQLLGEARLTRKQRQARRDMLAAQIILHSYLESPEFALLPPEEL